MSKPKDGALLTAVELEMMRVLWQHGPSTVQGVLERLNRDLAYTSVLTMLRILEQKGYARRTAVEGQRGHVYAAAVTEDTIRKSHLQDLLDRFFDGRPEQLVTGLLQDESLTRRDIDRLRALIGEHLPRRDKGSRR